jgi:uncharacterized protein (TIGR03067 family)
MKPLIYVLSLTTITLAGCTSEKLDNCSSENLDITGRWTVVGLVQDGKPWGVSSGFFFWEFREDLHAKYGHTSATYAGTYTIDQNANPKQLDLATATLEGNQLLEKGIIEIKNGKLRICVVHDLRFPRPTSFTTKKGDGWTLYTLERRNWVDEKENSSMEAETGSVEK